MSKRSLPLAVMALLLAGLAAAEEPKLPTAASRCSGIADLEKALATQKIAIASLPENLKKACEASFWTYLDKQHAKGSFKDQYTGQAQLAMIKDALKLFDELDLANAAIEVKIMEIEKDAATIKGAEASRKGRWQALGRVIAKEGEPLVLAGKLPQKEPAVKGGSRFDELYELYWKLTAVELIKSRSSFTTTKGAPFTRQDVARLWDGSVKPGKGVYAAIDPTSGHLVAEKWQKVHKLLNEINAEIKKNGGSVATMKEGLERQASLAREDWSDVFGDNKRLEEKKVAGGETAKVTQDIAAFTKSFQESTAAELFDNIKRRQALDPSDPEHLSPERAEELKKKYEGGAAEVREGKIVYTVPGKEKGKRDVVAGTETPLPTELTAAAAQDLGKKVAGQILAGDPVSAKKDAILGAVLGDSVGVGGKPGAVGNLTVTGPGPKDFMDQAAAASCGSPLDLGKSKAELAMEAREESIAGKKSANSAARQSLRKECEGKAKDIDGWLEKEQAGIRGRHQSYRSNPSLNGDQIKADAAAEKSELADAEKAHAERIAKLQGDCEEKLKKVGYKSEVEKATSEEEKALAEEVRKGYMEPAKGVPAKVEAAKAGYKKSKAALATAMTEAGVAGSDLENPYKPQWILDDQLFGENGYFTTQWEKEPAKTESYKKMLAKLGVPAEGAIDNNKLKDVSEVPGLLEADLVAWYKAYVQKARSSRGGGAVTPPKPGEQTVKPGEKAKLKVDFDR